MVIVSNASLNIRPATQAGVQLALEAALDVVAGSGLLLLSPFLLLISVIVRVTMGSPVLCPAAWGGRSAFTSFAP